MTLKQLLLIVLAFSCFIVKAQKNDKCQFVKVDTSGINWNYMFSIKNINLKNATKIFFFKQMKNQSEKSIIKEITVKPIGSYFLILDNDVSRIIKNELYTSLFIPKKDYLSIINLTYGIVYNNSETEIYTIILTK
jgi:hypothetical protein